jgi:hypothetical protein
MAERPAARQVTASLLELGRALAAAEVAGVSSSYWPSAQDRAFDAGWRKRSRTAGREWRTGFQAGTVSAAPCACMLAFASAVWGAAFWCSQRARQTVTGGHKQAQSRQRRRARLPHLVHSFALSNGHE